MTIAVDLGCKATKQTNKQFGTVVQKMTFNVFLSSALRSFCSEELNHLCNFVGSIMENIILNLSHWFRDVA